MQRPSASIIAAVILLFLAAAFYQIPLVRDMAAQQLFRQFARLPLANRHYSYKSIINLPAPLSTTTTPLHHHHHHHHPSSRRISTMADSKPLLEAVESRRTYYQLTNESTIADARIKELVAHTVKHVPSAFNSQTSRLVVVLKEKHEELWDAIMEVYKVQLPADKFEHAKGRMVGFRKAYGTVSFVLFLIRLNA